LVAAIRDTGATCSGTALIFFYGIFEGVEERLSDLGVQLLHLCTWWDVLEVARARGSFDKETLDTVEAYLRNPAGWTPGVMV
jgi:orotate phosphoribosyltransferase